MDIRDMDVEGFDTFMRQQLDEFKKRVQTHEDYEFARNGENMRLGDWFEQFACNAGLM